MTQLVSKWSPDHENFWHTLTRAMYNDFSVVAHQIESYNEFIQKLLQDVIADSQSLDFSSDFADLKVVFKEIFISTPQIVESDGSVTDLTPSSCRLRNLNYRAPMFLRCQLTYNVKRLCSSDVSKPFHKIVKDETVYIGLVPVMVGSCICTGSLYHNLRLISGNGETSCPNDLGGYFIINGNEKVVVNQERMACNSVLITNTKKHGPQLLLRCLSNASSRTNSTFSMILDNSKRKSSNVEPSILKVILPYLRKEIPFPVIFYALGITSVSEMISLVLDDPEDSQMQDFIVPSIEECYLPESMTAEEKVEHALDFIGKQANSSYDQKHHRKSFSQSVLSKYFLPHVSVADTGYEKSKAIHLGYLVNQFCQRLLGRLAYDDRDHLHNKRIDSTGQLLASLFRQSLFRCVNQTKANIDKSFCSTLNSLAAVEHFRIGHFFSHSDITTTFKSALATGNWVSGRKTAVKVGVSQILNRFSYMATLSHLRRISSTMAKDGNVTKPRQLHNTHFGRICLWETPEGSACVHGDTMVNIATQKMSLSIQDLHGKLNEAKNVKRFSVRGFSETSNQMVGTACEGVLDRGERQCVRVQLLNGQSVVCTPDHQFLCFGEDDEHYYFRADQLTTAHRVLCSWDWPAAWPGTANSMYRPFLRPAQVMAACRLAGLVAARHLCIQQTCQTFTNSHDKIMHDVQIHSLHLQPHDLQIELASFDSLSFIMDDIELLQLPVESVHQNYQKVASIYFSYEFYSFYEEMLGVDLLTDPFQVVQTHSTPVQVQNFYAGFFSLKNAVVGVDHLANLSVRLRETSVSPDRAEICSLIQRTLGPFNRTFGAVTNEFEPVSGAAFTLNRATESFRTYTVPLSISAKTLYQNICFAYDPCKQMKLFIAASFQGHSELFQLSGSQPWSLACFLKTTNSTKVWKGSNTQSNSPASITWCVVPVLKVEKLDKILRVFDVFNSLTNNFVANTMVVHNCGFVKNFAMSAKLSGHVDSEMLKHQLMVIFSKHLHSNSMHKARNLRVIVNGAIVGSVMREQAQEFITLLKDSRRAGFIHPHVSVRRLENCNVVEICSDPGRILRPMLVVKNNQLLLTPEALLEISTQMDAEKQPQKLWHMLTYLGYIEYLDVSEESTCLVAMFPRDLKQHHQLEAAHVQTPMYTHCEIHPSFMAGVCGSGIPFADTNQGPRNIYQSSMIKQSMGFFISNFQQRFDSSAHVLWYAQKPLVQTHQMNTQLKCNELPGGQNLVVAIMAAGFNQEDSIIMNQSSVDRGLFRSDFFRTYQDEEQATDQIEEFCNPDPEQVYAINAQLDYSHLDGDGLAKPGSFCESNSVLVGKTGSVAWSKKDVSQQQILEQKFTRKDRSQAIRPSESGAVDKVLLTQSTTGTRLCKVRMRNTRVPEMGDKFCLTPDHDVLTNDGWVPIWKVTQKHRVATLATDQSTMIYLHPLQVFKFKNHPKDDQMHLIQNLKIDLCVTREHRLFCKLSGQKRFCLRPAWEMEFLNYTMKRTGKWRPKSKHSGLSTITIYNEQYPTVHVCRLLSLWFSNRLSGHLQWCSQDFSNKIIFDMMVELLKLFACKFKECRSIGSSPTSFWVQFDTQDEHTDSVLAWLRMFGKQRLPTVLFNLKTSYVRHFINSLLWFSNQNFWSFSLMAGSSAIVDQLQHLAVHAELGSVIVRRVPYPTIVFDENGHWPVSNKPSKFRRAINRLTLKPEPEADTCRLDYHDFVYCLEVPDGVFMVRRNGKPCWTGNSSRHGQKGTVGLLVEAADMPFSQSGIQPDIIINPHCIPSRMTIAHLIETLGSKLACQTGEFIDSTPFTELSVEQLTTRMHSLGFQRYGNERLYNGTNGKPLECDVFFGPVYYQRLKHMVADKLHCLTLDHEVLTDSGWKTCFQLLQTDLVATLHEGDIVYLPVINHFYYEKHDYNIVSIKSASVDLQVSSNHRLWCRQIGVEDGKDLAKTRPGKKFELIEVSKVNAPVVEMSNTWDSRQPVRDFLLPAYKVISRAASAFCFGWMAHSWQENRVAIHSNEVCFTFPKIGGRELHLLKQQLEKSFKLDIAVQTFASPLPSIMTIFKPNGAFMTMLKQFQNNQLPISVGCLSQNLAIHFLQGFCFMEGIDVIDQLAKGRTISCQTSNARILGDLQRIVLHAGLMQWSEDLTIYFAENVNMKVETDQFQDQGYATPGSYSLPLFCLEVDTEIFMVRRKGKICWTGNSRSRGPCQLFQRQPVEGRSRDGGLVSVSKNEYFANIITTYVIATQPLLLYC